jgi:hypothetical protein
MQYPTNLKDSLPVHGFPIKRVDFDDTSFEIVDVPYPGTLTNRHQLRTKKGHREYLFDPMEHLEDDRNYRIGVVQITPKDDGGFRIITSVDDACCEGIGVAYDLLMDDEPHIENFLYTRVPFVVRGILGAENYALFSGAGCSGNGIRMVDFDDLVIRDVYSNSDVSTLFFEPPQLKHGRFCISYFDEDGNLLTKPDAPDSKDLVKVMEREIKGYEAVLNKARRRDDVVRNKTEVYVDDCVRASLENPDIILGEIGDNVVKSRFIYNHSLMNPISVRSLMHSLSDRLLSHILGDMPPTSTEQ